MNDKSSSMSHRLTLLSPKTAVLSQDSSCMILRLEGAK